jgi:hypothetical protein
MRSQARRLGSQPHLDLHRRQGDSTTHACDVVTTGSDTPEGALAAPTSSNFSPNGTLYVSDNNKHVHSFTITG